MPVKYFITQDFRDQELTLESSQEALAVIEVIKRVYVAFTDHQNLYAIIANVDKRSLFADFVIITEHGIGIMNLHHDVGSITQKRGVWYAGEKPIPGNDRLGYRNPYEKVQICAENVRDKLMNVPQHSTPWLPGRYITWQDLIFDTAVCFTNREADIDDFRKYYPQELKQSKNLKMWERFSIVKLDEIPQWVAVLCFNPDIEAIHDVQSYRLTTNHIIRIVTGLFRATEWTEINKLVLASKPYAYLLLKQNEEVIRCFNLDQENMTIGRETSCDIAIPKIFRFVSRVHAKIRCSESGIFIEDCSRNGTFVNDTRIDKPTQLHPGQHIMLGGDKLIDGVCLLELSMTSQFCPAAETDPMSYR